MLASSFFGVRKAGSASDTGTCIFLVEVYEDDRHGAKP